MFQYLNGLNSEIQDKQAEAYQYESSGTVGIAKSGVIEGLVVSQTGTASGSVLIGPGACIVQGSLGQGADRLCAPSQETLDIFTANPVGGLPRNDILVADSLTASITAIIGTPNATPSDPTVPNTSLALARLRHAASATTIPTAKIDTLIVATTLRGAVGANGYANEVPIPAASVAKAGKRIHWGSYTGTTSAGGYNTVTHGAGFTPTAVVVTLNDLAIQSMTDIFTATTFRIRVLNSDGSSYTGAFTVSAFLGE